MKNPFSRLIAIHTNINRPITRDNVVSTGDCVLIFIQLIMNRQSSNVKFQHSGLSDVLIV